MKKGDYIELNRHMQTIERDISKQLRKELSKFRRRRK